MTKAQTTGSAVGFTVSIPRTSTNSEGAIKYIQFLKSKTSSLDGLRSYGLTYADSLPEFIGDVTTVPAALLWRQEHLSFIQWTKRKSAKHEVSVVSDALYSSKTVRYLSFIFIFIFILENLFHKIYSLKMFVIPADYRESQNKSECIIKLNWWFHQSEIVIVREFSLFSVIFAVAAHTEIKIVLWNYLYEFIYFLIKLVRNALE